MFAASVFTSLLVIASASDAFGAAISRFAKRDNGCSTFPVNGLKDNADFFSLWAQYDDSKAEVPLAMSTFGSSGSVDGSFLAPSGLAGVTVGSLFQLNNSGLIGIGYPDGNDQTKTWISQSTEDGGPLPFTLSKDPATNPGIAQDYCELFNTDPNGSPVPGPVLAGEGTADNWSICNRTDNALQQGVVLRAASFSSDFGYDFSTCESVHVFLRSSTIGNEA